MAKGNIITSIGLSPITDKIYIGKVNQLKRMWVGEKRDITNDFIAVMFEYIPEQYERKITSSKGNANFFINVANTKEGISKTIKSLEKKLSKLEQFNLCQH